MSVHATLERPAWRGMRFPRGLCMVALISAGAATVFLDLAPRWAGQDTWADSYALAAYQSAELRFEEARGRYGEDIEFISRGSGYAVLLARGEAYVVLQPVGGAPRNRRWLPPRVGTDVSGERRSTTLRLTLLGERARPEPVAESPLPGVVHDLTGRVTGGRTDIRSFARVRYREVYPGIDLVYYGRQTQLEYDFIVTPGADPGVISFALTGAKALRIDDSGRLVATTSAGEVVFRAPVAYQGHGRERRVVRSRYVLAEDDRIGFALGDYDPALPLVIDPVLDYATYVGGGRGDYGLSVARGADGSIYLTGHTVSVDFPVTGGVVDGGCGIDDATCDGGNSDVFVTRLNAAATAVVFSTYLGGSGNDYGYYIDLADDGTAVVVGETASTDFRVSPNAYQSTLAGGAGKDSFIARLSADGSQLHYASYLGGGGLDTAYAVSAPTADAVYVVGYTDSMTFPSAGAPAPTDPLWQPVQPVANGTDAFLAVFDTTAALAADSLRFATYVGGTGADIAEDIVVSADGRGVLVGWTTSADFPGTAGGLDPGCGLDGACDGARADMFVIGIDVTQPAAIARRFATYLGGAGSDQAYGVALATDGSVFVVGDTNSAGMPVTGGVQPTFGGVSDAYVAKLAADGTALVYGTYLGGSGAEFGGAIAVDTMGVAYVVGDTVGPFPTASAPQPVYGGGPHDAFIVRLAADGARLIYASYIGGTGDDGAADVVFGATSMYVVGSTRSQDFPVGPTSGEDVVPIVDAICGSDGACNGGLYDAFAARVSNAADLGVAFALARTTVPIGEAVAYRLTVRNSGPDSATGVVVTGDLPGDVVELTLTPTQGSCTLSGLRYSCAIGELATGVSAAVQFGMVPTTAGRLGVTASVTGNEADPVLTDDDPRTLDNTAAVDGPTVGELYNYEPSGSMGLLSLALGLGFVWLTRVRRRDVYTNALN